MVNKDVYIARLIVRLEGKLSSLGRATLFSVVPSHLEGHHRKVEGHIKIFRPTRAQKFYAPPLSNCCRHHCQS